MSLSIRPGALSDLDSIEAIYTHYVLETPITFDLEPVAPEARRAWLGQFSPRGRHRLLVAEEAGRVVGWSCSHGFRARPAYLPSVETSIYLDPDVTGRGLGVALYAALFAALEGEDVHRAYAGITLPNPASEALHRRFGFEPVGTFREVGRKFGRYWDVRWYERPL